ncbi:MAG TPA: hypothetical protein VGG92_06355, partial [Caulobacteraceae bacterium]
MTVPLYNLRATAAPVSPPDREFVDIRPNAGLATLHLRELWRFRELLYFLTLRDLKIRYKQTAIGVAWALIQPVLAVAIFTVIFGHFAKMPSG